MSIFAPSPYQAHRSIGRRHGLLGIRPSNTLSTYRGYRHGYRAGRCQAVVQTVVGFTGIVFSIGVILYTLF